MSSVFAEFLFNVALMIAGYFFVCSAISYAIEHYFKVKDTYNTEKPTTSEDGE